MAFGHLQHPRPIARKPGRPHTLAGFDRMLAAQRRRIAKRLEASEARIAAARKRTPGAGYVLIARSGSDTTSYDYAEHPFALSPYARRVRDVGQED